MIPNVFIPQKIPEKIPKGMQDIVKKINKCKTKTQALKKAYDELGKTHSSSIFGVWKYMPTLFIWDINKLWKRKKLLCTSLSFILRILLVKSIHFEKKDVKQITRTTGWICLHVFLKVNTGKKWITVDFWGKTYGIPFGKRAKFKDWFLNIKNIKK